MRTLTHELGTIYVPGPDDSLAELYRLAEGQPYWAADTETTGTNPFAPGFRVRLVQVGTRDQAWILNPEYHRGPINRLTCGAWWHNAMFDSLALENDPRIAADFYITAGSARDTSVLSRLLDPRDPSKGGVGHKLEDLAVHYLRTESKKAARTALLAEGRRLKLKATAANIFERIPVDNEVYLYYAGQDVFLAARLAEELEPLIVQRGLTRFSAFEHPLQVRLAAMQRTGMPFDRLWAGFAEEEYDEALSIAEASLEQYWHVEQTASYVHTSRLSLRKAFEARGVEWTKFSEKSGDPSMNAEVLAELVTGGGEVGALALDVLKARKAKHYGDYIRIMRAELGRDGRIHPVINSMQAATHRMSVTGVPIQQFPRNDPRPRGCLLPDPGDVIVSCDYAQVEFRVGAAVSGDPVMRRDILEGRDLHAATATALFGPGFTKDQRQVAKPVGFGRLYLGSARGIRQAMLQADPSTCPPLPDIRRAIKAFDTRYRGVVRWAHDAKDRVSRGNPVVVTATGRPLIVDKPWAAPNYLIQSPARDIFAHGINRLWKEGYGPYLRLVVHDEVVLSVPQDRAEEVRAEVERLMSTTFLGVPIVTESKVLGQRWAK